MAIIEQFAANILTLTQTVNSNIKGCFVSDRITFDDSLSTNLKTGIANNQLWFAQTVRVNKTLSLSVQDNLVFNQQTHPKSIHVLAYSGFILWDTLDQPKHNIVLQTVVFNQTATGVSAKATRNQLVLTQSVGLEVIKVLPVVSNLNFVQGATAWKESKWWIAVPSLMYAVGPLVAFKYKGQEFESQAPEIGNRENVEYLRINRESVGGDRQVFRDANWPITTVLSISFNVCQESDIARFRNLIKNSLGDFIEYRDHNGLWWDAFIMNPDTAIKQTGRQSFNVNIELEATAQ